MYGGKTLFEQFDPDIQRQIELLCVEIKSILQEGVDLLERRYGVSRTCTISKEDSVCKESPATLLNVSTLSLSQSWSTSSSTLHSPSRSRTSASLPGLLRWSLRDKKRVEAILQSFKDRNSRLKKKVELWCLASQLGVSPEHLMHLQTDKSSRKLGFDQDASPSLAQWDPGKMARVPGASGSLVGHTSQRDPPGRPPRHVRHVHQEQYRLYPGESSIRCHSHTCHVWTRRRRANQGPDRVSCQAFASTQGASIPRPSLCGVEYLPRQSSIAFVFEVQPKPVGAPVNLQRLLFNNTDRRPEIGDKFRLALGISKCIAQMHIGNG